MCELTQQQRALQIELRAAQAQVRTTQDQLDFAQVAATVDGLGEVLCGGGTWCVVSGTSWRRPAGGRVRDGIRCIPGTSFRQTHDYWYSGDHC